MNKFDECQRPFSPCWCETRPNNPHCKNSVSLPIDSYYFIIPLMLLGILLSFTSLRGKIIKK